MATTKQIVFIVLALVGVFLFSILVTLGIYLLSLSQPQIEPVTKPVQHAENPYWDAPTKTLYFVDTFQSTIYKFNPKNKNKFESSIKINDSSIGPLFPIKDKANTFVLSANRFLYEFNWSGGSAFTKTVILDIEKDKPKNQLNDGGVDAKGRLWLGTLERNADNSVSEKGGAFYLFDLKNKTAIPKIAPVSISNSITWSNDNTRFYYIDSASKEIWKYDFDLETGKISNGQIFLKLQNLGYCKDSKKLCIADGMLTDEKDDLWITLFGGGGILNVNSKTGKLNYFLKMPVSFITNCVFGGPSLDILYVTTSKLHLNADQLKQEPDAGSIFAVTNLGVKGLPAVTIVM